MKNSIQAIHWIAYAYYAYLFGYASLFKIIQKKQMVDSMASLGFGKSWTLLIGYAELLGWLALILGIWFHQLKNAAVLWLFPFAIGALMVHFAHHEYKHFYSALFGCICSVVLLLTNKHFRIIL